MANKSFYDKSDLPTFREEVCKKTCIMKGRCIEDGQDDHFFLMCPHYFNWKTEFKSFVAEQLEWQREHPEEAEARRQANLELSKKIKAQRRQAKKYQSN